MEDRMLKRGFDVMAAAVGLVLLSPLFLLVGIWVRCDSRGPVFHRGNRVGRGGRPFRILKFRTMVTGAERMGPGVTAGGDPRVTRVGRLLRAAKLDELPQLINVLRGEMSLVGPRPEDPRYVALYTPEQRRTLAVRPGITSLASVQYRDEEAILTAGDLQDLYTRVVMPAKLAIELDYLERRGFLSDLRVLGLTAAALFASRRGGRGAAKAASDERRGGPAGAAREGSTG